MTVLGAGFATALSGCLDFVRGSGPLDFEAGEIHVEDEPLAAADYRFEEVEEVVLEREFEAGERRRNVVVTNTQAKYIKEVPLEPIGAVDAAVFSAVATPSVSLLGREYNPLGDLEPDELAELVQDRYAGIRSIEHAEYRRIGVANHFTTVGLYEGEARFRRQPIDIRMCISEAVPFRETLAIGVGIYPDMLDGEDTHVLRLISGIRPAD